MPVALVPPVLLKVHVIEAGFGVVVPELLEHADKLSDAGVTPATVEKPSTICVVPPGPEAVQVHVDG